MDTNMDVIHIKNLEVFANHGVHAEETALGQKFIINADLYTDFSKAAEDDDLALSVHYGHAARMITEYLQQNTYKLIETAACRLAEHMLLNTDNLMSVRIEIKKPWAPVKYSMETVSAEVFRGWHTVYLSLGSNMGNREQHIANALNALKGNSCIRCMNISPIYETEPYGGVEQPAYLNACVGIRTVLEPMRLLDFIHQVENQNGRERTVRWGARTLDIDILLYDDLTMHTKELTIPHTDMTNRLFVLKPLNDIAPYAYHTEKAATVAELYESLSVRLSVNREQTE